jgi:viologen exporter family transport system permease protein
MYATLTKYRHVFLIGLQSNLVYRWNFLIRGGFSLVRLAVAFILWGAVYAGNPQIGGYNVSQTLTYFVALIALQFLVGAFNEDYQIGEEIRNGLINQFLLKPINYYSYRFTVFASARAVSGLLILVPLLAITPLLRAHLVFPGETWRLLLCVPALTLAALLQFTLAYCFGLLAFWFLEIQGFVILSYAAETMLSGQIFPLDLLPPALFRAAQYLPFYYMMYFPAGILTGRINYAAAIHGFALQAAWVVILAVVAHFIWVNGLRKHTAVGG